MVVCGLWLWGAYWGGTLIMIHINLPSPPPGLYGSHQNLIECSYRISKCSEFQLDWITETFDRSIARNLSIYLTKWIKFFFKCTSLSLHHTLLVLSKGPKSTRATAYNDFQIWMSRIIPNHVMPYFVVKGSSIQSIYNGKPINVNKFPVKYLDRTRFNN